MTKIGWSRIHEKNSYELGSKKKIFMKMKRGKLGLFRIEKENSDELEYNNKIGWIRILGNKGKLGKWEKLG